ncbi:MAG TPA: MarR family transcriptional regulator [Gordonia sp. (in: high G+C Gram-positive bacteria)]|uniref:MarR family winged helix-turn-helix transcriptional regulator n=1 Tax=unclassified Gordonia (in: high G+C Gram-positive bacteria) TaxID=2657482 RepID=UPI0025C0B503|nr:MULTISPECIES: MarR family transcriptional regulator [unclassified Gordonia (in: high G+C Gram-positive bacteria)]HNP58446.1 MarR family transcriptional regulator [Gordonia sp. (in: high G+C Gram-positive bacteria)]HRC52024.1 MarR family transcriptional regulator [Gordonia sp. (in: high G+C Gram-positive bacteria)]
MTPHDDLARELRPALTRLYLALRRRAPVAQMSAAQASALSTLMFHGPIRMGELAQREGIRMPTATALVDGMIRLGLVHRRPDPDDRRAVLVDVTDDGRAAVEDARRHRDDALTAALERLSDEHLELLAAATPALHELQQQLESIAPAPAVLGAAE